MTPREATMLIAGLFTVGSACFLIGNVIAFVRAYKGL